ncbi:DUF2971 domain-containing protein [Mycolicibacterium gadium]|uniref:DUF2971 domain-containing protein n=1 Tax=Mycolicibacterium gadium TaxID=1794 RepID=A0A7I7WEL5_MYCGU|nr:DUF2971 domain-containing protein [Mycolicibacterium gadium]BBZ15904.1 hypothetical protein MGAD_02390 [Mycolicibacterium gadium]
MSVEHGDNDDPSILYHYTDAYGVVGIVDSSWRDYAILKPENEIGRHKTIKLQASDIRFMNDTEELKFGTRLLRNHLEALAVDPSISPEFRAAFADIAPYFFPEGTLDWPVSCYATSFCVKGDLLSQWRGYAGGTGGFALGLDRDGLENRSYSIGRDRWPGDREAPAKVTLKRVVYGEDAGIAAIDEHIEDLMKTNWTSIITDRRPQHSQQARLLLFTMLVRAVAIIKDDAFKEEKEWRLFTMGEFRWPVDVRARARGLLPYKNIAVNVSWKATAPEHEAHHKEHPTIVDLVVGPGPEQAEQVVAARELLKGTDHEPKVVRSSKVTYR